MSVKKALLLTLFLISQITIASQEKPKDENDEIRYYPSGGVKFNNNLGLSISYLQRYNPEDSRKPFKGPTLAGYWADAGKLHKLELSVLDSELEVLGPGVPRDAERTWDAIYSFDNFKELRNLTGVYFNPSVGLRLKEKLTVTCKDRRSHCFYATHEDWSVEDRTTRILPTLGAYTGFRVYSRYLVYDMNIHAMTDFEDTYLSWSVGIGLLKPY